MQNVLDKFLYHNNHFECALKKEMLNVSLIMLRNHYAIVLYCFCVYFGFHSPMLNALFVVDMVARRPSVCKQSLCF